MVRIRVGDLKASGELDFEFVEKWSSLDTADGHIAVSEPVCVRGKAIYTGSIYIVEGEITTTLELTCDRCLTGFSYRVSVPMHEEYSGSVTLKDIPEDSEENVELRPLEGEVINIGPAVEEALILSLPMKYLCRESCRGLCPVCGRNLNEDRCDCMNNQIDPRFAVLKDLLSRREGEN